MTEATDRERLASLEARMEAVEARAEVNADELRRHQDQCIVAARQARDDRHHLAERMEAALSSRFNELTADIKALHGRVSEVRAAGSSWRERSLIALVAVLTPTAAFLFIKLMGW